MSGIYLLDCTLRDGGYVNNWEFGNQCIHEFTDALVSANIDIIELGFIRRETANPDRSVFVSADDLGRFKLSRKRKDAIYSVMIEGNERDVTYPVEKLGTPEKTGIDLIRICTWKRLMDEHFEYCKEVGDLGYKVSVQPTAIDQYNDKEFEKLCLAANDVNPFVLYLVDTWGTQSPNQIRHYAEIADEVLNPHIKIGYHGHNNKMQALSCMITVLTMSMERDICIDGTVMGMGRGPGNLQTEVAMDYLNNYYGKNYDISIPIKLYSKYIKRFYDQYPWGYSIYHYISANHALPQDFASYFREMNYSIEDFERFIDSLSRKEKVTFRKQFVENRIEELGIKKIGG